MENKIKQLDIEIGSSFNFLIKILFIIGGLASVLSLFLFNNDSHYFYFSYLTVYCFFLTLTLGGMFIVLIHYITSAGWSVVVKRIPELLMKNIGLMALLTIPIIFGIHDLYHWSHLEDVMNDHLLQIKAPFLNQPFFIIRIISYFLIWKFISNKFFKLSNDQDIINDPEINNKLQKSSAYSMILFALTLTFAFIDLVMSLTPHWYSTIFGVYMFAGAVVVGFCFTSILYIFLRSKGFLKDIVTVEHYHDLGKLIYGFNIFWSYIAFCQFFLIWYANVPEETVFYMYHSKGSWFYVILALIIGHFFIPFILFMSRFIKRNLKTHLIMAVWLVIMHFIDLFWIIMPTVSKYNFDFRFIDFSLIIAMGCLYFGCLFLNMKKINLIPKNDPRLKESLSLVNM